MDRWIEESRMWKSDWENVRTLAKALSRRRSLLVVTLGVCLIGGCSSTGDFERDWETWGEMPGSGQPEASLDTGESERIGVRLLNGGRSGGDPNGADTDIPVALVNDEAVQWPEFRELLAETSGGVILRELVLDRMLRLRILENGGTLGAWGGVAGGAVEAEEAERQLLLASLDPDPEQAARLLRILRDRRSLGPRRFAKLLRRNAMLRMLIRDSVEISEARLQAEFIKHYGPSYRVRLIMVARQTEAEKILAIVRKGDVAFNELAAKVSTDLSAARGGLLLPFSPKDESFPRILREVIPALFEGEISPILPIDDQFAIVQMVEHVAAREVRFETVRTDLELSVRRLEERRAMDVLAQELLDVAEVVILDRATSTAWERLTAQ